MPRPTRLQQLRSSGWQIFSTVAGLLISANVLPGVSLTIGGLIIAVAVIDGPIIPFGLALDDTAWSEVPGDSAWFAFYFLLAMLWIAIGVPVADFATNRFNIDSFGSTVGVILIVLSTGPVLKWLHGRLRQRDSRR